MKEFSTPYGSRTRSPGYQLWIVSNSWQRRVRAALKEFDLTHVQFALLMATRKLSSLGIAANQARISENAGTDKMMTSQVLRSLEVKGLVKRTTDEADARARRIVLTEAGEAIIVRAFERVVQTDADFFAELGDETGKLTEFLRRLAEANNNANAG
ncbi:MAG: MarR family winged helix-turn-helix transcriptional regulator [Capsulimonadaceae bacterium]|nr:MarR family winged helix-turn-helix transcriptional regulator [Capsulimonadaceae bacterium]